MAIRSTPGMLVCEDCGYSQPIGDIVRYEREGWPRHCEETMRWQQTDAVAGYGLLPLNAAKIGAEDFIAVEESRDAHN